MLFLFIYFIIHVVIERDDNYLDKKSRREGERGRK